MQSINSFIRKLLVWWAIPSLLSVLSFPWGLNLQGYDIVFAIVPGIIGWLGIISGVWFSLAHMADALWDAVRTRSLNSLIDHDSKLVALFLALFSIFVGVRIQEHLVLRKAQELSVNMPEELATLCTSRSVRWNPHLTYRLRSESGRTSTGTLCPDPQNF